MKQRLEIVKIDEGIQIDRSDEHLENDPVEKVEIAEPNSNARKESFEHHEKDNLGGIGPIDEGMQAY
jgi:hypothetical protein